MSTVTRYSCNRQNRRQLAKDNGLNGIDFLEVLDHDAPSGSPRQRTLLVRFLSAIPATYTRDNVMIEGGVRITPIHVQWAHRADSIPATVTLSPAEKTYFQNLSQPDSLLLVRTDAHGDYSTYRLSIAAGPAQPKPPAGIDSQLSQVDFSFKVECLDDFDCKPVRECAADALPEPEIDYLAKDFATFRRLMLDRMSVIMPDWRERNPADMQVALVELLAYVGDHLSYTQDAVATEAYLGTARRRVSLRRHAHMLDYSMHDGCNARVWVTFHVKAGSNVPLAKGRRLLPAAAAADESVVFETLHDSLLRPDHYTISFYTWGDEECCLPRGSTRATLKNDPPLELAPGDVLIFEEIRGPLTGADTDADASHRQAVRLTSVEAGEDPLNSMKILEIEWHEADALTFPLCLSTRIDTSGGPKLLDVSVARGNVVLADFGQSVMSDDDRKLLPARAPSAGLYRPRLRRRNITFATAYVHETAVREPAARMLEQDPRTANAAVRLRTGNEVWEARRDLLSSNRFATEFVVETERDLTAFIRFGDDLLGKRPASDVELTAEYRVGNGRAGNIGADVISRVANAPSGILRVRNPLPAAGGSEPESMEEVRQYAPQSFRRQERAVTEADYARAAEQHPDVQKAAARFRWTGSWFTVFITIDRKAGRAVTGDTHFTESVRRHIERYRLAGYDVEIRAPVYVPLDLALRICVKPGYFRSHVKQRLMRVFSSRDLPNGETGFFHPDRFTFGQPVYLSQIYETATSVDGVASVDVVRFQRWNRAAGLEIEQGLLQPADIEIVRLDNDPSFPENGHLEFIMGGGL